MMVYNRSKNDGENTYSIDRLTFDFYFVPQPGLTAKIKAAFDMHAAVQRHRMDVQAFQTNRLAVEKQVYQFDAFHAEVYERGNVVLLGKNNPETGEPKRVAVPGVPQTVLRLDFNPNNCVENPVLMAVMEFLAGAIDDMPYTWSLSRVDYALDIPGTPDDFYILSRKAETFYENTRYYGERKATGRLKVYDKRRERIEKARHDIGRDLTRFEWTQRGNRDFNFKFDQICRYTPEMSGTYAALLQFVRPEMINHALGVLDKRTKQKVKNQCFHPLTLDQSLYVMLLDEYLAEYSLPLDLRRDWEKQFQSVPSA